MGVEVVSKAKPNLTQLFDALLLPLVLGSGVKIMSEREVIRIEAILNSILDTMDDVCIHDRC
jgi:hypothetical protein